MALQLLSGAPLPTCVHRPQLTCSLRCPRRARAVCAVATIHAPTQGEGHAASIQPVRPVQDFKGQLEQLVGSSRHMLRDSTGRLSLKNLTFKQMETWCQALGEPKRALQLWRWLYADGNWIRSLSDTVGTQNGISQRFIDGAEQAATCDGGLELQQVVRSRDGTRKLVFKLRGGEAAGGTVESVLIPVVRSAGQKARITLCVSTQVGCAQNCQFCYTGRMGLLGNLTTAQIVEQGEPLHNPEAVADAIEIMNSHLGLHMSHNKVTVSTVGLIPEIKRFAPRSNAQLAVSLHATTDEVRDWVVPINRRYPLAQLMATLRELYPAMPHQQPTPAQAGDPAQGSQLITDALELSTVDVQSIEHAQNSAVGTEESVQRISWSKGPKRRRRNEGADAGAGRRPAHGPAEEGEDGQMMHGTLLIAYLLLRGVNDTPEDAHRLLDLLDGIAAKINLIIFNAHEGTVFLPSTDEAVHDFRSILVKGGRVCTVRSSRGEDEMAACGQLGDIGLAWKPAPLLEPPPRFRELLQRQQEELRREQQSAQESKQPAQV